jgi:hypothetical protein
MISLKHILVEQLVRLKPIQEYESDFGESYPSPYVKGPHKFYEMIVAITTKAGEVEYGDVDEDTLEIISIHIDKMHRGKGYGRLAFTELMKATGKKRAILKAAASSRKFWKSLGFQPLKGSSDYYFKEV